MIKNTTVRELYDSKRCDVIESMQNTKLAMEKICKEIDKCFTEKLFYSEVTECRDRIEKIVADLYINTYDLHLKLGYVHTFQSIVDKRCEELMEGYETLNELEDDLNEVIEEPDDLEDLLWFI